MALMTTMMEEKAIRILQSEFGFKPEKSKLIYHDSCSWNKFIEKKDKDITGLFRPRELIAHINKNPENTLLARIIHEYLGHGSYCEHARNGKKIVEFEKKLRRNEDEKLLKEYKQFYQQNFLTYEGFAVWLEEFLLNKLNKRYLWNIRIKEIKNTHYEKFYNEFKKFEQENGLLSLIYKVGFPKQFNKDSIKKFTSEHLNLNELEFLILYGSKRDYGDVDLLAVSKNNDHKYTGHLDIIQVAKKDFVERLKLFDIELTEPILTGELIIGNEYNFKKIKKQLFKQKFSEESSNYLKKRILNIYNNAEYCYDSGVYEAKQKLINNFNGDLSIKIIEEETDFISPHFLISLNNMSYIMSYSLSNELYKNGSKVLSLNEIIEKTNNKLLKQIIHYTSNIKKDLDVPTKIKTKEFLNKTKEFLLKDY